MWNRDLGYQFLLYAVLIVFGFAVSFLEPQPEAILALGGGCVIACLALHTVRPDLWLPVHALAFLGTWGIAIGIVGVMPLSHDNDSLQAILITASFLVTGILVRSPVVTACGAVAVLQIIGSQSVWLAWKHNLPVTIVVYLLITGASLFVAKESKEYRGVAIVSGLTAFVVADIAFLMGSLGEPTALSSQIPSQAYAIGWFVVLIAGMGLGWFLEKTPLVVIAGIFLLVNSVVEWHEYLYRYPYASVGLACVAAVIIMYLWSIRQRSSEQQPH